MAKTKRAKKNSDPIRPPRWGRVRRRAGCDIETWRKLGRPNWVLKATEVIGTHPPGDLYYHTFKPLYEPLDLYIGTTEYTVEVYAGTLLKGGPDLEPVVVQPLTGTEFLDWPGGNPPPMPGVRWTLWDRSMGEHSAQRFTLETEDPDYVEAEQA